METPGTCQISSQLTQMGTTGLGQRAEGCPSGRVSSAQAPHREDRHTGPGPGERAAHTQRLPSPAGPPRPPRLARLPTEGCR